MEHLNHQNLKYGIIYVMGNPKQTYNLRWFASMIKPMIRPLSLEWVETWDYDHTLIVARRFNVGNMGKYATVQLHLNSYGHSDSFSLLAAVHAFSDCLQDVMDDSEGDVIINESDYRDRNQPPQGKWGSSTSSLPMNDVLAEYSFDDELEMRQDHTRVEPQYHVEELEAVPPKSCKRGIDESDEEKPSLKDHIKKIRAKLRRGAKSRSLPTDKRVEMDFEIEKTIKPIREVKESREILSESSYDESRGFEDSGGYPIEAPYPAERELDIEVEELDEYSRIEAEYERDVKDLRARIVAFIAKYHQDPQQMMNMLLEGKVLIGNSPSRVLVNGDMKIVLPEYDEMEIKMPAMCRTLYILFMKQRKQGDDGIVLRNIDEHRQELLEIYGLVKPGASEQRVRQTVDNLCDPLGDSLNQTISRINRCIRNVITDKQLAQDYCITGERGEQYGIGLDPQYLELPRAVTGA